MMICYIKKCFEQNCVASFYCDSQNPESHLTGFVGAYDKDFIVIKHISPDGLYDGFILIRTSDVFRIDFNGVYEDKVDKLYKYKNQSHPDVCFENDLYSSILKYSQSSKTVVSVEIEGDIIAGLVEDYDSEFVCLIVLDKYGRNDGKTVFARDNVISIATDTSTEHDIYLLKANDMQ